MTAGGTGVVITDWALQSYLDLVHRAVFSKQEYWTVLRPDVERLKRYPIDANFGLSNFWSQATIRGVRIPYGFKMKWHNVGPGQVQLRLTVAMFPGTGMLPGSAVLCSAYVKSSKATEARELAKFKDRIKRILSGQYVQRGVIQ
jgi:hypothetical protein